MDDPSSKHQDLLPMCDDASSSSKKKKLLQKTVVTVKMEANEGKNRGEGPPSDFWSWRKYGQKPIKGSPYPRGYYRCSTSKGCSAKKQVERSRTDASVLIITYTCDHNHPGPNLQSLPIPDQENQPKWLNTQTPIPKSNSMLEMNQEVRREEESNDGKPKSLEVEEDNDFYDELEELLPMSSISSSFSSLTRGSNFFDERILLLP